MKRITRRAFGQWMGAGVLAGSFLRGLEGVAHAADNNHAKRLIVFFSPNGTIHSQWRPNGSGSNFDFPAGSVLEPLTPYKSDLIVVDGVNFFGTSNHEGGMAHMLTGGGSASTVGGGASIDQYVAQQIGGGTAFPSLELGVMTSAWGGGIQTRMSYSAPGTFVPPDDNPANVYQRLQSAVATPSDQGPSTLDIRRQSVLDLVQSELNVLRSSVGTTEAIKLDQHLESIKQLEVNLQSKGLCGAVSGPDALNAQSNDNFPAVSRAQMDLMVTALSCGMTRVASLQMSHTVSPVVFSWLGHTDGHHSLSHTGDENIAGVQAYTAAERWFASEFAWLLGRLSETPDIEYGGQLIDHTLVVWAQEMGDGRLHDCLSVPFVLAGAKNVLNSGQYLQFGGEPHQKLLVSICHALGIDTLTYGDPSHGAGPLGGILS
jgi:hypothetical protein